MSDLAIAGFPAEPFGVEVDGQIAASWDAVIGRFADASVYQTWAYAAVRWGGGNLSHLILRRDGAIQAAIQIRLLKTPVLPLGVAYARCGPLCHPKDGNVDSLVLEKMLEAMRAEYCARRGLMLQIIPNAFAGTDRGQHMQAALERAGFRPEASLPSYRTIVVDLAPAAELLRKRLDQKWRNQLNGSERNGLELEVTSSAAAYREFERLYQEMWDRKKFETSVDVGEFGRIQEQLPPDHKMTVFIARKDSQAVGALVCSLLGDTAIYVLGATNERARDLKASYFLHWQAMLWLKARGARWYDLGGIDPKTNPGGHHFKSGFGGSDVTQVAPVSASGGLVGKALFRGVLWLRRARARRQDRAETRARR